MYNEELKRMSLLEFVETFDEQPTPQFIKKMIEKVESANCGLSQCECGVLSEEKVRKSRELFDKFYEDVFGSMSMEEMGFKKLEFDDEERKC